MDQDQAKSNGLEQGDDKKGTGKEQQFWYLIFIIYSLTKLPDFIFAFRDSLRTGRVYMSDEGFYQMYNLFAGFALISVFPIFFRQIFGQFPVTFIYSIIQKQNVIDNKQNRSAGIDHASSVGVNNIVVGNSSVQYTNESTNEMPEKFKSLMLEYIEESNLIAEKIYTRAGAYLLAGCMVAFTGIVIFYSPWFSKDNDEDAKASVVISKAALSTLMAARYDSTVASYGVNKSDTVKIGLIRRAKASIEKAIAVNDKLSKSNLTEVEHKLLGYIPRFGALFFIEFIAFFFFKQYRIMLEEYRYYESIKRKRQDNLNFLDIVEKNKDNAELLKLLSGLLLEKDSTHKLSKEESTQVIETHKVLNTETDVFGKLTDLVKAVRGS